MVREDETEDGTLGTWDEERGEIRIAPGQDPFVKLTVVIREIMRAVETMMLQGAQIPKRIDHDYVEKGAYGIATLLVHLDMIDGVSVSDWRQFLKAQEGPSDE